MRTVVDCHRRSFCQLAADSIQVIKSLIDRRIDVVHLLPNVLHNRLNSLSRSTVRFSMSGGQPIHVHHHSVFCNMNAQDQVVSFSELTVSVDFTEEYK